MLLKFRREESGRRAGRPLSGKLHRQGKSTKKKTAAREPTADARRRHLRTSAMMVRLEFSDHEKLTQQRWLDRFAAEEPFKSSKGETIRQGSAAFAATADLFESLG